MSGHPHRAGQAVRGIEGGIGITTTDVAKRSPTIGVMFLGGRYDVKVRVELLAVIEIAELIEDGEIAPGANDVHAGVHGGLPDCCRGTEQRIVSWLHRRFATKGQGTLLAAAIKRGDHHA